MLKYTNSVTGATVTRADRTNEVIDYRGKTLILEVDMQGYITYINRRFVEISGYTKEELIGLPHCIHMHPEMPEDIFKDACSLTSEGKTWNGYIKNITKTGATYWTETVIQPKRDEQNNITGFMTIRREPDPEALAYVIREYKGLTQAENKGKKSQYCGEVYMDRAAGCSY